MPNANYLAGRRFEYETQRTWEAKGYSTIRASGSHGHYDCVAFKLDRKPEFIQCKVTEKKHVAKKLIESFKSTQPSQFYHQTIVVKIKGVKPLLTYTV